MIEEGFINKLNLLNENNFFDNLEIKRGIEREALRVDTCLLYTSDAADE